MISISYLRFVDVFLQTAAGQSIVDLVEKQQTEAYLYHSPCLLPEVKKLKNLRSRIGFQNEWSSCGNH